MSSEKNYPLKKLAIIGICIALACVVSFFFLDHWFANLFTEEQYNQMYRPVRELTELGVSSHFFVFCAVVLILTTIRLKWRTAGLSMVQVEKLKKLRGWTLTFLYSLIASGAVIHVMKFLVGRQRPHRTDIRDPQIFNFFTTDWHFHSFPSGHTQTVFTVATALAFTFPRKMIWFYSAAVLVAFTRVLLHEHFVSDLLMGGYIGYAMTLIIFIYRQGKS